MIKAVIFDLDDTLISELEYIKSGFKEVAKYIAIKYNYNQTKVYKELMELFKENSKNVFNRFLKKNKILYEEYDIKKIVEIYREHKPNIKFYDDVIPTIKKLKKYNIKIGIITDGYKETQKLKLDAVNAYDIFDEIIMTDELGKEFWKPSPKAFEIIKERLSVEFEEMIYVGDNPEKDFYINKIHPIKTVRVNKNKGIYSKEEYLENIIPNYIIKSFKQLKDIIKEN